MKEKMREINSIKGVWGYFLCDNTGKILEREMPIVFMKHLAVMGKEVTQVVGLLESLSRNPENLDLLFKDGRVMIKSLKNFTLVVFCDPNVDIPMLRLKINVLISEISGDSKMQELFQKSPQPNPQAPLSTKKKPVIPFWILSIKRLMLLK